MGKTPHSTLKCFHYFYPAMKDSQLLLEAGSLTPFLKRRQQLRTMKDNELSHEGRPTHRILVVDDEPDIRRLNAEVLKSSGYEVDTAEDGKAGWQALQAVSHAPDSYDLLITDHNMPGLS